ncbi:MAG: hypothetical protein PHV98_00605 [Candidatus Omnitrophica bacterium]|nr:hypothetical protein [Candidatus Omnitrophota bacterium]
MQPINVLLQSRKFWLLVMDTVISLALLVVGLYNPTLTETVNKFIVILQPVFVAVITGIFVEDAAGMLSLRRVTSSANTQNESVGSNCGKG